MSYLQEQIIIENYAKVNIPGIAFEFDNVALDTSNLDEWIRLTILSGDSSLIGLGGGSTKCYRIVGVASFQIFVKQNIGSKRALELADQVVGLFRTSVDSVKFISPSVKRIGMRDGWYQVNADCPFYRDDTV